MSFNHHATIVPPTPSLPRTNASSRPSRAQHNKTQIISTQQTRSLPLTIVTPAEPHLVFNAPPPAPIKPLDMTIPESADADRLTLQTAQMQARLAALRDAIAKEQSVQSVLAAKRTTAGGHLWRKGATQSGNNVNEYMKLIKEKVDKQRQNVQILINKSNSKPNNKLTTPTTSSPSVSSPTVSTPTTEKLVTSLAAKDLPSFASSQATTAFSSLSSSALSSQFSSPTTSRPYSQESSSNNEIKSKPTSAMNGSIPVVNILKGDEEYSEPTSIPELSPFQHVSQLWLSESKESERAEDDKSAGWMLQGNVDENAERSEFERARQEWLQSLQTPSAVMKTAASLQLDSEPQTTAESSLLGGVQFDESASAESFQLARQEWLQSLKREEMSEKNAHSSVVSRPATANSTTNTVSSSLLPTTLASATSPVSCWQCYKLFYVVDTAPSSSTSSSATRQFCSAQCQQTCDSEEALQQLQLTKRKADEAEAQAALSEQQRELPVAAEIQEEEENSTSIVAVASTSHVVVDDATLYTMTPTMTTVTVFDDTDDTTPTITMPS